MFALSREPTEDHYHFAYKFGVFGIKYHDDIGLGVMIFAGHASVSGLLINLSLLMSLRLLILFRLLISQNFSTELRVFRDPRYVGLMYL